METHEKKMSTTNMVSYNGNVISDLESTYIKLLESKIHHLQTQLDHHKTKSDLTSEDDNSQGPAAGNKTPTEATSDDHLGKSAAVETEETRYRMILTEWDRDAGEFREKALKTRKEEFGPQEKPAHAFTFRKFMGIRRSRHAVLDDISTSSEIDVIFPPLQKLLGRLASKYGLPDEVTKCGSPYGALIHAWNDAQREAYAVNDDDSDDDRQARDDLKELLKIISTSSGDVRLDRYFKNRDGFLAESTITHDALWTLFPPGTLVLARPCHEEPQVFVVDSCDLFVGDDDIFEAVCFCFDWNGKAFRRVPYTLEIPSWGGDRRSVTGLPFYPLDFYVEGEGHKSRTQAVDNLKERLMERGRQFAEFCRAEKGKQMFNYVEGDAYFHGSGAMLQQRPSDVGRDSDGGSIAPKSDHAEHSTAFLGASWKPVEGAVIVDFASYLTYQSVGAPLLGSLKVSEESLVELSPERRTRSVFKDMYRLDWDRHLPKASLSDEQLLCCPPRVLGYALKRKTWVQLLVKNIKDAAQAKSNIFDDELQLDEDAKMLISNSVKAHSASRKRKKSTGMSSKGLDDFAPEKGRGLVIMLYGQPGVGKTLTAESVAQMSRKPLLSVGVSDIGIEGDKVETNLQKVFALAGLWEAILLFDEADVFLEARGEGDNDLRRNAMVSVLLRVLEYYEGILILTTNRMRSLDIAVQSRIHLAIKFTDLKPEQKTNIYKAFFDQLHNKGLIDDMQDLQKWVKKEGMKYDFNGRQIRNIISTALGLAQADNRMLERDDLASVARQTDNFKRDLSTQEAIYRDRQINQRA